MRAVKVRRWVIGLAALAGSGAPLVQLALAGCGGSVYLVPGGGDAGGSGDSGGGRDGGAIDTGGGNDGGGGLSCPASPPQTGGLCAPVGLECEYGTSPNPSCNLLWTCTSQGWQSMGNTGCPVGICPPTYASATGSCQPSGLVCTYPEGTCDCSEGGGPVQIDGGVHWLCTPIQPGCPSPRPDIGTPCDTPGLSCNYGACTGDVQLGCTGGIWQAEPVACPVYAVGG